jgi:hypothetical protein
VKVVAIAPEWVGTRKASMGARSSLLGTMIAQLGIERVEMLSWYILRIKSTARRFVEIMILIGTTVLGELIQVMPSVDRMLYKMNAQGFSARLWDVKLLGVAYSSMYIYFNRVTLVQQRNGNTA